MDTGSSQTCCRPWTEGTNKLGQDVEEVVTLADLVLLPRDGCIADGGPVPLERPRSKAALGGLTDEIFERLLTTVGG